MIALAAIRIGTAHAVEPGAVALFKLERSPDQAPLPHGTQKTGLEELDARLRELGAYAFPAFPFDRGGTRDVVGLDRWVAIVLPAGAPASEAFERVRHTEAVLPESFLQVPQAVPAEAGDPGVQPFEAPRPELRLAAFEEIRPFPYRNPDEIGTGGRAARAVEAPGVWAATQGVGVGIAIVDSGIDTEHHALAGKLRVKVSDDGGADGDGNGIPGDALGVNLSGISIVSTPQGPALALREPEQLADAAPGGGHGTALAAIAAGERARPLGAGVAPGAWLLAVRVSDEGPPSSWAYAAGVVYAASEGVRVLTCAWPGLEPSWLLHDALLFAEDNCVLAICARESEGKSGAPESWREARLTDSGGPVATRAVTSIDPLREDFHERPLRALMLASLEPDERLRPDVMLPPSLPGADVVSARVIAAGGGEPYGPFDRPGAAAALAAGVAALVLERRPDLEPWAVRDALISGPAPASGPRELSAPAALHAADKLEKHECAARRPSEPSPDEQPFWKRIKVKTTLDGRDPAERTGQPDDPSETPDRPRR